MKIRAFANAAERTSTGDAIAAKMHGTEVNIETQTGKSPDPIHQQSFHNAINQILGR